ncbi:MAG: rhodanese-related sulfurtransferase [Phenylobacterium sp.]|nr:rhodanese-related sulfurtransferase [Phenylobacterium sp.]
MKRIAAAALMARLGDGGELALLDVREQGVHYKGHPFFASSAPLSRLECMIADLVPRRAAPVVVFDGGDEGLAETAAARLRSWGYADVSLLEGGLAGWQAAGYEVFGGVNVPSKAFGEFVEHHYETPRISADELKRLKDAGTDMVILDSRPLEEYRRMHIPGGIDSPGAELAFRVHDLAPRPETLVVVNCAGRTRSIIGAQSLINAGIPNKVVALKDGTMGWDLAGYTCARGAEHLAPVPTADGEAKARAAAERVARRFGVRRIARREAEDWLGDGARTAYLLDVRPPDEYAAAHIEGSRHAPGGQLVQATDEYCGVRNARLILVDPLEVRAVMTASWLIQLGWRDVAVLEPEGGDGFAGWTISSGKPQPTLIGGPAPWPSIGHAEWDARACADAAAIVIDLATSLHFRARHIPGAWWAVRARLAEAKAKVPAPRTLLLTSEDGLLARLAAPEAAALWPRAEILVLDGGNANWFAAGLPVEKGLDRSTTAHDDVWYKPYDHERDVEKHMRDYLSWEVALVEQIKRDPTIGFRAFD